MATIAGEFKGLPMEDLIGGPLAAACVAQIRLANATADFIKLVGFLPPPSADASGNPPGPDDVGGIRNVSFQFTRPTPAIPLIPGRPAVPAIPASAPGVVPATAAVPAVPAGTETVDLTVPLLAIVRIPALSVDTVDVVFHMEVKSSSSSKSSQDEALSAKVDASARWGVARVSISIQGSVSSHQENTRSSDNSAKYHVEIHASDKGMPEGLARVLNILNSAIVPVIPLPTTTS
jgi:hypothetical protein